MTCNSQGVKNENHERFERIRAFNLIVITILSPPPLAGPASEALDFVRHVVMSSNPFDVGLGRRRAADAFELKAMHDVLNTGLLGQTEAYDTFQPARRARIALGNVRAKPGSRARTMEEVWRSRAAGIERLTFMQQHADGAWNLEKLSLGQRPSGRVERAGSEPGIEHRNGAWML